MLHSSLVHTMMIFSRCMIPLVEFWYTCEFGRNVRRIVKRNAKLSQLILKTIYLQIIYTKTIRPNTKLKHQILSTYRVNLLKYPSSFSAYGIALGLLGDSTESPVSSDSSAQRHRARAFSRNSLHSTPKNSTKHTTTHFLVFLLQFSLS